MRAFIGILSLLAGDLFAKLTPGKSKKEQTWEILYEGSFLGPEARQADPYGLPLRSGPALVTLSGDMIASPTVFLASTYRHCIAQGLPGVSLSPTSTLVVEVLEMINMPNMLNMPGEGVLHTCKIPLSEILPRPLKGYIEIKADKAGLRIRACQYTFGHSVSYGTGNRYPSVKNVGEKTYGWEHSHAPHVLFQERGIPMAQPLEGREQR